MVGVFSSAIVSAAGVARLCYSEVVVVAVDWRLQFPLLLRTMSLLLVPNIKLKMYYLER
jgi:hypothetical protein